MTNMTTYRSLNLLTEKADIVEGQVFTIAGQVIGIHQWNDAFIATDIISGHPILFTHKIGLTLKKIAIRIYENDFDADRATWMKFHKDLYPLNNPDVIRRAKRIAIEIDVVPNVERDKPKPKAIEPIRIEPIEPIRIEPIEPIRIEPIEPIRIDEPKQNDTDSQTNLFNF